MPSNVRVKKVVVHGGFMKTASTSIQDTLFFGNEEVLGDCDVHYLRKWGKGHGGPVQSLFSGDPYSFEFHLRAGRTTREQVDAYNEEYRERFFGELAGIDKSTVVISGENIAEMDAPSIARMHSFLAECFPEAELTASFYVREHGAYHTSLLATYIKSGHTDPLVYPHFKCIENFHAAFSKECVHVYSFEETLKHSHGPVGFFLATLGVAEDKMGDFAMQKSNEGVSDKSAELIYFLNSRFPFLCGGRISLGRYDRDTYLLSAVRGPKFALTQEALDDLYAACEGDIQWLKETAGIDYSGQRLQGRQEPIVYDQQYFEDITKCFVRMTPLLQRGVYDFMIQRAEEVGPDQGKDVLLRIIDWMMDNPDTWRHGIKLNYRLNKTPWLRKIAHRLFK